MLSHHIVSDKLKKHKNKKIIKKDENSCDF